MLRPGYLKNFEVEDRVVISATSHYFSSSQSSHGTGTITKIDESCYHVEFDDGYKNYYQDCDLDSRGAVKKEECNEQVKS